TPALEGAVLSFRGTVCCLHGVPGNGCSIDFFGRLKLVERHEKRLRTCHGTAAEVRSGRCRFPDRGAETKADRDRRDLQIEDRRTRNFPFVQASGSRSERRSHRDRAAPASNRQRARTPRGGARRKEGSRTRQRLTAVPVETSASSEAYPARRRPRLPSSKQAARSSKLSKVGSFPLSAKRH